MRLSLYIDNALVMGVSYNVKPNNNEEMIQVLEDIIEMLKSPIVPYEDLLDKAEEPHPRAIELANELFKEVK